MEGWRDRKKKRGNGTSLLPPLTLAQGRLLKSRRQVTSRTRREVTQAPPVINLLRDCTVRVRCAADSEEGVEEGCQGGPPTATGRRWGKEGQGRVLKLFNSRVEDGMRGEAGVKKIALC